MDAGGEAEDQTTWFLWEKQDQWGQSSSQGVHSCRVSPSFVMVACAALLILNFFLHLCSPVRTCSETNCLCSWHNGSIFFFFCSDISSFENEKVWVVPVVRKLFCADENWSEFVTRLLHESLFHCCCKAFFAYLNCCHWHCYSYSTSFKSSAIQLFGSYVPGPSLYVDCSHLKSLSLHLRDNIAFSLTGRLSRFYQGLFVAQMWGS